MTAVKQRGLLPPATALAIAPSHACSLNYLRGGGAGKDGIRSADDDSGATRVREASRRRSSVTKYLEENDFDWDGVEVLELDRAALHVQSQIDAWKRVRRRRRAELKHLRESVAKLSDGSVQQQRRYREEQHL